MEGPYKNSEGLFEYAESSDCPRVNRSPVVLTLTALMLIAVLPFAYFLSKSLTEELCESEPGGRGYSGDKAPEEASAICDWARSN